jgi:hypothetical protein
MIIIKFLKNVSVFFFFLIAIKFKCLLNLNTVGDTRFGENEPEGPAWEPELYMKSIFLSRGQGVEVDTKVLHAGDRRVLFKSWLKVAEKNAQRIK